MNNENLYTRWRPAVAWSYLAVCLFDFMIGPMFFNVLHTLLNIVLSIYMTSIDNNKCVALHNK